MCGYIAYRNWKSDELERKRKGVKKRIDIYKAVSEHLHYIDRNLKIDPQLYDLFRHAHYEAKFYFLPSVDEFLETIDINSHQWLLEYNSLQEMDLLDNDDLNENLDVLTSCSRYLESKIGAYVLKGHT